MLWKYSHVSIRGLSPNRLSILIFSHELTKPKTINTFLTFAFFVCTPLVSVIDSGSSFFNLRILFFAIFEFYMVHYMTQITCCKRRCSHTQLITVLFAPRASQIVWKAMDHLACGEQTLFSAFISPAEKRASLKIVHVWFLCFSDKHCLVEIWEVNDAWECMPAFAFQILTRRTFSQNLGYDNGHGWRERKAQHHEKYV